MGFERMCKVLQLKDSVYDTDLFVPAISVIENHVHTTYTSNQRRFRIVADHARTAFMLINDGLIPSNVGAGYVLRMIIRRMVYNVMLLHETSLEGFASLLQDLLTSFQTLRNFNETEILRIFLDEIKTFQKTIQNGMQILTTLITKEKAEGKSQLPGADVFKLYDTYGFPLELTKEIAQENGLTLDETGYQAIAEQAKEKSRQATKEMFKKGIDWSKYLEGIPQTEFIGYSALSFSEPKLLKEIELEGGQNVLIFDKTPFYPEMGGQMGDF
jgi:alanyl-tRNA synthetase